VRSGFIAVLVAGAIALAACSAPASRSAATSTTTSQTSTTTSQTSSTASTTSPATTATSPTTSNLAVTGEIRAQLVAAGAAMNSLTPAAYTGLVPGETFYAYDTATMTYWAGAGLVPSSTSTQAQISAQDDGAYLLFERPAGGSWKGYDVGLAGTKEGGACPVSVPTDVLRLWNWAPGSCRPSTIG
jgi:hypothetical protein